MDTREALALCPNPTVDKSASIDRVAPEVKLRCDDPDFDPGGGGVNVARVMNRLEVDSQLLYPAGGPHGEFLKTLLEEEGLLHESTEIDGFTRESYTVLEKSSEQQYRFSHPGPELAEVEWERHLRRIEETLDHGPDYVVGSGSLPPGVAPDQYAHIGKKTREADSRFILDASGDDLQKGLQARPFLIKPNLRELRQLVEQSVDNEEDIVDAAGSLLGKNRVDHVAVSIGAGGALLVSREGTYRYQAPTVTIDSKVGAGDSMVAGIVYGLLNTDTVSDAVRYGVAAGTAAVTTPGTELCRSERVHDLYDRVRVNEINV